MTREEAIKWMEETIQDAEGLLDKCSPALKEEVLEQNEVFKIAISALRSVSREQVDKLWKGKWIIGEPEGLGVPIHCNRCGWGSNHADQKKWMEYQGHIFCGRCGAPMSDEAVQMVMERLEGLK